MVFAWGLDKAGMALKQACPLARVLGACDLVRRVVDERISPVTKQSALGHVSDSQLFSHHRLHRIPKDGDDCPHHISFTHDFPPAPDKHSIASQYSVPWGSRCQYRSLRERRMELLLLCR